MGTAAGGGRIALLAYDLKRDEPERKLREASGGCMSQAMLVNPLLEMYLCTGRGKMKMRIEDIQEATGIIFNV